MLILGVLNQPLGRTRHVVFSIVDPAHEMKVWVRVGSGDGPYELAQVVCRHRPIVQPHGEPAGYRRLADHRRTPNQNHTGLSHDVAPCVALIPRINLLSWQYQLFWFLISGRSHEVKPPGEDLIIE